MFDTVLFPIDRSRQAMDTAAVALKLAQQHASTLVLLSVVEPGQDDPAAVAELLQQAPKPTVALCMGAHGMASRVLGAKFGAFLTYARAQGDPGTAPGQPTVSQLRELYRFDSITPRTRSTSIRSAPKPTRMPPGGSVGRGGRDILTERRSPQGFMRARISRTASSTPVNNARLTMLWPMFNS